MTKKDKRHKEYLWLKETGQLKAKYQSIEPPHGLISALINEDYDIASEMLEEDPELIDRVRVGYSETALQWLVTENALEQVRFLIEKGADFTSPDDEYSGQLNGRTPLEKAQELDYKEMQELLLSYINRK